MALLDQNVTEDPQIAPSNNNNTELEGGQQNMMGFPCMKAVFKINTLSHLPPYIGLSLTRKPETQKKKSIKEYHRSDPIRCLAVMKLARFVFAYVLACTFYVTSITLNICMRYMQLRSTHSHRFVYVIRWVIDSKKSRSSKLHSTPNSAMNLELSQGQ